MTDDRHIYRRGPAWFRVIADAIGLVLFLVVMFTWLTLLAHCTGPG